MKGEPMPLTIKIKFNSGYCPPGVERRLPDADERFCGFQKFFLASSFFFNLHLNYIFDKGQC
jgi:hypothetical protein